MYVQVEPHTFKYIYIYIYTLRHAFLQTYMWVYIGISIFEVEMRKGESRHPKTFCLSKDFEVCLSKDNEKQHERFTNERGKLWQRVLASLFVAYPPPPSTSSRRKKQRRTSLSFSVLGRQTRNPEEGEKKRKKKGVVSTSSQKRDCCLWCFSVLLEDIPRTRMHIVGEEEPRRFENPRKRKLSQKISFLGRLIHSPAGRWCKKGSKREMKGRETKKEQNSTERKEEHRQW